MLQKIYGKDELIDAIIATDKPISFLVGSPLSADKNGGVPTIGPMLEIIKNKVTQVLPGRVNKFEEEIKLKKGAEAYQSAMEWLQTRTSQDKVNEVVREAVLKAYMNTTSTENSLAPNLYLNPENWYIPSGVKALGQLVSNIKVKNWGPIITPNFDPLIALAIKAAGGRYSRTVITVDGSLQNSHDEADVVKIVHFHGYWDDADTMHTPNQLTNLRPKLKESLKGLLRNHFLVVVAYSGWDDVFTKALAELFDDQTVRPDIRWCFYDDKLPMINEEFKNLLEKIQPALSCGRFIGYGGIDCHTIFYDIASEFALQNHQLVEDNGHDKNGKYTPSQQDNLKPKLKDSFKRFLYSADILTKAHSQKEQVKLDDIFVYPDIVEYDFLNDTENKINSKKLIDNFKTYNKILIVGENQSGKTSLCKKLFLSLIKEDLFPIYISEKLNNYQGKIEKNLLKAFSEQYDDMNFKNIDKDKIVPILDNFHLSKKKKNQIDNLCEYKNQIIIVDDVFSLNYKDEKTIKSFSHFKIKEFNPTSRNELIEKWMNLSDSNRTNYGENDWYSNIDHTTDLVNSTLGKIMGSGIMPSYPFFILSIISTYEAFDKPLNQEITSQGYCYQALISLSLIKQGVKGDDLDTYFNFMTELAFYIFQLNKSELSRDELNVFVDKYIEKYYLPIDKLTLIDKLLNSQILSKDSFNNIYFKYLYLYYFSVAKYLSDNIKNNNKIIDNIINNLHKDENAYIAIFISHHSRDSYLIDMLAANAICLFDRLEPATLTIKELDIFDEQIDELIKAALPPAIETPEKNRKDILQKQDKIEERNQHGDGLLIDEDESEFEEKSVEIDFRRSVKTVEVMGQIARNRVGSLERSKLESVFEQAMNVYLRILKEFITSINDEELRKEIVDFISNGIKKSNENKKNARIKEGKAIREISEDEIYKISKKLFWNLNFYVVYGIINKVINSLGSNKLINLAIKICDQHDTPASFLVKQGILMKYNKNLQTRNLVKRINQKDFSKTAMHVLQFLVVNHCAVHKINFRDRQLLEQKLGLKNQMLLHPHQNSGVHIAN